MIFGVPAEQQQCATSVFPLSNPSYRLNGVNTEQFFRERECKTRSGSRAE